MRRVRTIEGSRFYNLPIGAPITKDVVDAAKAAAAIKGFQAPKGALTRDKNKLPTVPTVQAKAPKHEGGGTVSIVKSTISGPVNFKVGKATYSAPDGSRLIKKKSDPSIAYVRTPDGEVHAFNEDGEVATLGPIQNALKAIVGKDELDTSIYDPMDLHADSSDDESDDALELHKLPENSEVRTPDGAVTFKKTKDGWKGSAPFDDLTLDDETVSEMLQDDESDWTAHPPEDKPKPKTAEAGGEDGGKEKPPTAEKAPEPEPEKTPEPEKKPAPEPVAEKKPETQAELNQKKHSAYEFAWNSAVRRKKLKPTDIKKEFIEKFGEEHLDELEAALDDYYNKRTKWTSHNVEGKKKQLADSNTKWYDKKKINLPPEDSKPKTAEEWDAWLEEQDKKGPSFEQEKPPLAPSPSKPEEYQLDDTWQKPKEPEKVPEKPKPDYEAGVREWEKTQRDKKDKKKFGKPLEKMSLEELEKLLAQRKKEASAPPPKREPGYSGMKMPPADVQKFHDDVEIYAIEQAIEEKKAKADPDYKKKKIERPEIPELKDKKLPLRPSNVLAPVPTQRGTNDKAPVYELKKDTSVADFEKHRAKVNREKKAGKPELSKEDADKLANLQKALKTAQDEKKKFAEKSIQYKIDKLQGTEKAPEPEKAPTPEPKMRDVEGEDIWDGEVASAEPGFGYRMHDVPQAQSYKKLGPNDWEHTDRFGKKSHATDAVVAKAWAVGGEGDHSWVPQVPADKKAEPKASEPQTSAFEVSGNPQWYETSAGTVAPKYQLGYLQRETWKTLTDEQRNVANTAMETPDESTGKHYTTASAALKKAQAHVSEKKAPEPKVPEAPKEKAPESEAPEVPVAEGDVDLDGDSVSKADIEAAVASMEEHSGFQIAYGLKSVPDNPLAKDKELQDRIKNKAMDAYPQLKPKAAMVKYLKEKAGIKKSDSAEAKKEKSGKTIQIGKWENPTAKNVQGYNGGEFDAADVQEAVDLLEGFEGKAFKAHLNKHNNPLGVLNPNDITGFEKDKLVGKQKFIDHLKGLLAKNEGEKAPEKPEVFELEGEVPGPKDVTPEAPKVPKQRTKPEAPSAPEAPEEMKSSNAEVQAQIDKMIAEGKTSGEPRGVKFTLAGKGFQELADVTIGQDPVGKDGGTRSAYDAFVAINTAKRKKQGKGTSHDFEVTLGGAEAMRRELKIRGSTLVEESEPGPKAEGKAMLAAAERIEKAMDAFEAENPDAWAKAKAFYKEDLAKFQAKKKPPDIPTQQEIEQLSDEDLYKLADNISAQPVEEPLDWEEAFKDITPVNAPEGWDGSVENAPSGASFESNFGGTLERVGPNEWQHYGNKIGQGVPQPKDEETITDAEAKAMMDDPNSGTWSPVDPEVPEVPDEPPLHELGTEATWDGHPDSAYNGDAYVNSDGSKLVQTSFGKWELWDKDGNKLGGPYVNDEAFLITKNKDEWTPVEGSVSNDELIEMESKPMPPTGPGPMSDNFVLPTSPVSKPDEVQDGGSVKAEDIGELEKGSVVSVPEVGNLTVVDENHLKTDSGIVATPEAAHDLAVLMDEPTVTVGHVGDGNAEDPAPGAEVVDLDKALQGVDPDPVSHQVQPEPDDDELLLASEDLATAFGLPETPVFTKKPVQKVQQGTHPIAEYTDQFGNEYLFKPRPENMKFRADIEKLGNDLGRFWGGDSAQNAIVEDLDGAPYGLMQKRVPGDGDLSKVDLATLNGEQLGDVANEHVLDWMLDNDDTKADNAIVGPDGHIVGIDKGRTFVNYGHWDGLNPNGMNTNAYTVYSKMFKDIESGKISKENADAAYLKMKERIAQIQASDMDQIKAMTTDAMKHRPMGYKVDYYIDGVKVPQTLDGLLTAIEHRKNSLDTDMTGLWEDTYQKAGYGNLPEVNTPNEPVTPASLEELSPEGMAPSFDSPVNAPEIDPSTMKVGQKITNNFGTVFTKDGDNSWNSVATNGATMNWDDTDMQDMLSNDEGWQYEAPSVNAPETSGTAWDGTVANAKSGDTFTSNDGSKLVNEGPGQWRILNPSGEDLGLIDQDLVEDEVAHGTWKSESANAPEIPGTEWDGTTENAKSGDTFKSDNGFQLVNNGPDHWMAYDDEGEEIGEVDDIVVKSVVAKGEYKADIPEGAGAPAASKWDGTVANAKKGDFYTDTSGNKWIKSADNYWLINDPDGNNKNSAVSDAEVQDVIDHENSLTPGNASSPAASKWGGTVEKAEVGHSFVHDGGQRITKTSNNTWEVSDPSSTNTFTIDDQMATDTVNASPEWKPDLSSEAKTPWDGTAANAKVGDAYVSGTSGNKLQKFGDNEWHVMNSEGKDVTVLQGDIPFTDDEADKTSKISTWHPVAGAGDWNGDVNSLIEGGEWDGSIAKAQAGDYFSHGETGHRLAKVGDDKWQFQFADGTPQGGGFVDDNAMQAVVKSVEWNNPNGKPPAAPKSWDEKNLADAPVDTEIKNINSGVTYKKREDGDWTATALDGYTWFAEDGEIQDEYDQGHIVPAAKADEIIKKKELAAWEGIDAASAPIGAGVQTNTWGILSNLEKTGKSQWQAYNADGTPSHTLEDYEVQHELDTGAAYKVAPGVGLPSGKYTKEGTKAHYLVSDDGQVRQVTSKGNVHDVDPATASSTLKGWAHTDSIDSFPEPGAKVDMGEAVSTTKKKKLANADLPAGDYKIGDKTLNVGSNGVISLNGIETTAAKIKTHYNQGKIHNDEGTSMLPDQYSGPLSIGHAAGSSAALPGVLAILEDPDFNAPLSSAGMKKLNDAGLKINPSRLFQVLKAKDPDSLPPGSSYDYTWNDDNPVHPLAKEYLISEIGKLTGKVDIDPPSAASSSLFDWEDDKTATRPASSYSAKNFYNMTAPETTAMAKSISAEFGNGKVFHIPSKYNSRKYWLDAFSQGDFKQMYQIEVADLETKGKAHPGVLSHPGAPTNQATHQVSWASPVKGEISASKDVDGDWSTINVYSWSNEEVNNYLIAAKMQNPEYLSVGERRSWVANHKSGHVNATANSSVIALQRKQSGAAPLTPTPTWATTIVPAKTYSSVFDNSAVPSGSDWQAQSAQAASDWAKDNLNDPDFQNYLNAHVDSHNLKTHINAGTGGYTVKSAVADYWNQKHAAHQAELNKPVFKKVKQLTGGYNETWLIEDQFGNKKVHKTIAAKKAWRIKTEIAGNDLGRSWGFNTPAASSDKPMDELNDGVLMNHVDSSGTLNGPDGKPIDLANLTTKQVGQLGSEHVLDWMLDNDDAHADNFLVSPSGQLVGIDKGRAFYHYGAWKGLDPDNKKPGNVGHPPVYEDLWRKIRNGEISQEQAAEAYKQARRAAQRIEKYDDARLEADVRAAVADRTDWTLPGVSSYVGQKNVPNSADELVAKVLERKHALVDDIEKMWDKVFKESPYEKPEIPNKLLGEEHVSGWDEPDLIDNVKEKKAWGQAAFLSGQGLASGQSKFWSEKLEDGTIRTRGKLFIDAVTQTKFLDFFKAKVGSGPKHESITGFPNTKGWKSTISAAAKDATAHAVDEAFDESVWTAMSDLEKKILDDKLAWAPSADKSNGKLSLDSNGMVTFPSGNQVPEALLPQYSKMLDHYSDQIVTAMEARSENELTKKEDFTQFVVDPVLKHSTFVSPDGKSQVQQLSTGKWLETTEQGTMLTDDRPSHTNTWVGDSDSTGPGSVDPATYSYPNAYDYQGSLNEDGTKETTSKIMGVDSGSTSWMGATSQGFDGKQYEVHMPDGESIWFRDGGDTSTNLTQNGQVQYSLTPGDEAASLQRIKAKLSELGLDFDGADEQDVEMDYWRSSFNKVINSTGGSAKVQAARQKLLDMVPEVNQKLQAKNLSLTPDGKNHSGLGKKDLTSTLSHVMTKEEEAKFWKDLAHDTWGKEKVDNWVADGRHMPVYQKMDPNNPDATHSAHFERIDAADHIDEMKKKGILLGVAEKQQDKDHVLGLQLKSGGMLSVESRLRILGQFIDGASSSSDQLYGAGNNIFTRLAHPGKSVEFEGSLGYGKHISYWSPDAMKFVESYSFAGDTFGEKNQMSSSSPYDIKDTLKFTGQGNETMIPEGLSVFDFLEIMVFQKQSERQKQIDRMKKLGFETLRGIPIEERFVMRADLNKALAKVRAQWT